MVDPTAQFPAYSSFTDDELMKLLDGCSGFELEWLTIGTALDLNTPLVGDAGMAASALDTTLHENWPTLPPVPSPSLPQPSSDSAVALPPATRKRTRDEVDMRNVVDEPRTRKIRLYEFHQSSVLSAPAVGKNETVAAAYPPYRHTARHVAHPRVGPYDERGACVHGGTTLRTTTTAPPAANTRCRSSSAATGTPTLVRWASHMAVLIPATSATRRKKAVRKGEGSASRVSSTAILCAAHAHCAEETLDESTPRHTRQTVPPRMGPVRRAGRTRGEGAKRAHPHDWPARRGYEVRELDQCDGEAYSCMCVTSPTRTRLLSPGSARARLPMTVFRRWGLGLGMRVGVTSGV
ncbi:hypothetical protein B0H13DRAFT_2330017 [Mycena leptocephala]|nr:hypothetical protein B0H13DRAFT_2330017 [Mycena leptocephala]